MNNLSCLGVDVSKAYLDVADAQRRRRYANNKSSITDLLQSLPSQTQVILEATPKPTVSPDPERAMLAELVNARDQLVALRTQLTNAMEHLSLALLRRSFTAQIRSSLPSTATAACSPVTAFSPVAARASAAPSTWPP